MNSVKITKSLDKGCWRGICVDIFNYSPSDADIEDVLYFLAKYAREHQKSCFIVNNTRNKHRLTGFSYYDNNITLCDIEGDYLKEYFEYVVDDVKNFEDSENDLSRDNIELICNCIRLGLKPIELINMSRKELVWWKVIRETELHTNPKNVKDSLAKLIGYRNQDLGW